MRYSPKRTAKNYFEEITPYDLYYQLIYMSATATAGISRARVFQLARHLASPPARYFKTIHEVAENLRYNYPDAVRLIGEQTPSIQTKTFLLRLSDALRSGEPLAGFLMREALVQGENYTNDYLRKVESLKKWTDAYASVSVSISLIVIINMVMTMIYNIGAVVMAGTIFVAVASGFAVAWIIFRTAPEIKFNSLDLGSKDQRLSRKIVIVSVAVASLVLAGGWAVGLDKGILLITSGAMLLPVGYVSNRADKAVTKKDAEVSSFLRSLGGTATSRGTTLKEALATMKLDSFPALQPDIRMLDLRFKSFGKPGMCWQMFRDENGSNLANQATGIFTEAVGLGGDPEKAGNLTSDFAMKTAMLREQRLGVSSTFVWLTIVMHTIMTGLMIFLLGVLNQFAIRLNQAMQGLNQSGGTPASLGLGNMFAFDTAQVAFLTNLTTSMIVLLAVINAFAVVASEGTHLIKMTWYSAILLICSGMCFVVVPPFVKMIL